MHERRPSFRLPLSALAALLAVAGLAAPAAALERVTAPAPDARDADWSAGRNTVTIAYYNICTGWIWTWSGLGEVARIGVVWDTSPFLYRLTTSWLYFETGAPPGYGYTADIAVHRVDENDCPTGVEYPARPFLPATGWNVTYWPSAESLPSRFATVVTLNSGAGTHGYTPAAIATDRPAPGPTGPIACGHCYPTTRVTHSYFWGSEFSPLCPGSTFFDGYCDAEILAVIEVLGDVVAKETESWGALKALYR